MTRFVQLHCLTFYPPSNVNRDDTGRPKTALVGGANRLRISSQALKRAWRMSPRFTADALQGRRSDRTRQMGVAVRDRLVAEHGLPLDEATAVARVLASVFGKPETKPGEEVYIRQLAFISKDEQDKLHAFARRVLDDPDLRRKVMAAAAEVTLDDGPTEAEDGQSEEAEPETAGGKRGKKSQKKMSDATKKLIPELRDEVMLAVDSAADIAMFGRMLADSPKFNREAAVQVAHALTTHKVPVEDDYYTAVDDLANREDNLGAGFLSEAAFGSGVFYLYACVDVDLLRKNLGGNADLAQAAVGALAEAMATITPSGKQNSFAALARAGFMLAERGDAQPRTLAGAFARPVPDRVDVMAQSVEALTTFRDRLARAYGDDGTESCTMDVAAGRGSLADIVAFVRG